ncbi:MAG: CinA family nicotinamide mononucleotide deamidase-related protein [Nitrospirae bacterium]|nr:CinA family nicotinamide mononucleotide deamidase-related protein [Nitrospirota bacterium]
MDLIRTILVHIGNELLRGETVNTNAAMVSRILFEASYPVLRHVVVADDPYDIRKALLDATAEADFVICTGGLGPTSDDLTAEVAASAFGRPLRESAEAWTSIGERFALFGRLPTGRDRKQALLPEGAEMIENLWGTAPGFCVAHKGATVFFLPGVPREAEPMLRSGVIPRMEKLRPPRQKVATRSLLVFGLREARINEILDPVLLEHPGVQFAFLPHFPEITLRVTGVGVPESRVEQAAEAIRARLSAHVIGSAEDSLEAVVNRLLRERAMRLALAESCTGGWIAKRLTDVPGSSEVFERAVVAYSNAAKVQALGVAEELLREHGAVSREVASEMARRVRFVSGVDLGLSVTGIAGPGGWTTEKPIGLVYIALAAGDEPTVTEHRLAGTRDQIRLLTSSLALDLLRRHLLAVNG